ncbi:MAG: methyltransferase domain-containing protein [Pseudomonadota bacterium]
MNNDAQIEYWNGPAGQKWVDQSNRLDAMLAPFAHKVLETAAIEADARVLDVGCGAGALTLLASRSAGDILGVDVSEPLLKLARERAREAGSKARFIHADASAFSADSAFDLVISRFGVMFFDDPGKAFSNIRVHLRPGGRMAFMCWQTLQQNDWAYAPLQAGLPLLKEPPPQLDPHAPGPFAFADRDRLKTILAGAGWTGIEIEPFTPDITLPGDSLESSVEFMLQIGPLARLITAQGLDPAIVAHTLKERFAERADQAGRISLQSACWMVSAKAP